MFPLSYCTICAHKKSSRQTLIRRLWCGAWSQPPVGNFKLIVLLHTNSQYLCICGSCYTFYGAIGKTECNRLFRHSCAAPFGRRKMEMRARKLCLLPFRSLPLTQFRCEAEQEMRCCRAPSIALPLLCPATCICWNSSEGRSRTLTAHKLGCICILSGRFQIRSKLTVGRTPWNLGLWRYFLRRLYAFQRMQLIIIDLPAFCVCALKAQSALCGAHQANLGYSIVYWKMCL